MARALFLLLVAGAALGGCASAPPPQVIYVDRYPPPPPRVVMAPPWHGPECSPPAYAMRPPPAPPGPPGPHRHRYGPQSVPKDHGHRVPQHRMGHQIHHERDSAQR